jgi:hypothetical protein
MLGTTVGVAEGAADGAKEGVAVGRWVGRKSDMTWMAYLCEPSEKNTEPSESTAMKYG